MPHASDPVRLTLEQRLAFEALVADLSAHFINLDSNAVDDAIGDALKRLGLMLEVDRGALTQLADGEDTLVFTHFWSRAGEPPPPQLRVDSRTVMPFGLSRLMTGDVHCFSSLDELPWTHRIVRTSSSATSSRPSRFRSSLPAR